MNILYLSLPISMILGSLLVFGVIYAVRSGQLDDLDGPAVRILEEEKKNKSSEPQ